MTTAAQRADRGPVAAVPHDHAWTLRAIGYDEVVAVRELECQDCGATTFPDCG